MTHKTLPITGVGVEIVYYDKNGNRRKVERCKDFGDAVDKWYDCEDEVLPTIWWHGKRVDGF